uniref:Retron-type reverse transcriptase n=1 Tax=Candidatus Kentrum sp. LPFa TaxID=2126335 RepID=A0A450W1S4_9GAMM|nr:MAG: Retron-type reverse transcriptase [Candidatus Kentron sp. LPFa]VFK30460.1 MAG: Retron-type reverse transcriptase [Candidatus Kentron sp. LPFa]
MKRIGNLWERITAFDNLYLAWRKARSGKATRPTVTRFELDLERNLLDLQKALRTRTYQPGEYYLFEIYDRKPRVIAAAPFPDRVAHHALMNPIEPVLDRRFIHDCYACRTSKGVHAAVRRYQGWVRRYSYVLKVDVRRYFPSIDHDILKAKLRRRIKDRDVLWLFDTIIDSAPNTGSPGVFFPGDDLVTLMERRCGLPIGNLTSQFLGNLYLDDLDHYLKEVCGVKAYLRYVDDLILLDDDKERLWEVKERIDDFLVKERLRLHPDKVLAQPTALGLDVLGYRVFPDRILLRRDNGYRYRRRLRTMRRDYQQGNITIKDIQASIAAWLGHARHANSLGLCRSVLYPVCFTLGSRAG